MDAIFTNRVILSVFLTFYVSSVRCQDDDTFAFDTWKYRDYEDYDLVKWGVQRGICPKNRGFCNEKPPEDQNSVVNTPESVCRLRNEKTSYSSKNILYEDVFCGVTCVRTTDCAPDENCCEDPCGLKICTKVDRDFIPTLDKKCPELLHQCQNQFKCIRTDQLCNGVNDCGDNSDERIEACKVEYAPVFPYGLQNLATKSSSSVFVVVSVVVMVIVSFYGTS